MLILKLKLDFLFPLLQMWWWFRSENSNMIFWKAWKVILVNKCLVLKEKHHENHRHHLHHGVVCLTSAIYMVAHANIDCRQSWGNQNLLFYSIQEVAMYMLHSALSKFSNKIQFKRMLQFFFKKILWKIYSDWLSQRF